MTVTHSAILSGSFATTLGNTWTSVRFCRARFVPGVWLLSGLTNDIFEPVMARLFASGGTFVSSGCSLATGCAWIALKAPMALAAKLATLFPTAGGAAPLMVRKGRVLSGAAERSALKALNTADTNKAIKAFAKLRPVGEASKAVALALMLLEQVRPLTLGNALFNGRGGLAWIAASLRHACSIGCWNALPNPRLVRVVEGTPVRILRPSVKTLPPAGHKG